MEMKLLPGKENENCPGNPELCDECDFLICCTNAYGLCDKCRAEQGCFLQAGH